MVYSAWFRRGSREHKSLVCFQRLCCEERFGGRGIELPGPVEGKYLNRFAMYTGFTLMAQVPAVLYLERTDAREKIDFNAMAEEIDTSVLSRDSNISLCVSISHYQHEKLKWFLAIATPATSNTTSFIRTSFLGQGCW